MPSFLWNRADPTWGALGAVHPGAIEVGALKRQSTPLNSPLLVCVERRLSPQPPLPLCLSYMAVPPSYGCPPFLLLLVKNPEIGAAVSVWRDASCSVTSLRGRSMPDTHSAPLCHKTTPVCGDL